MATFTGNGSANTANATTSTLTGFTGGTLAELIDSIGDSFDCQGDNDTVVGGSGNDTINGGLGADSLNGGVGNDIFNGGDGADTLIGDAGSDSFEYAAASEITGDSIDGGADSGGFGDDITIKYAGTADFTGITIASTSTTSIESVLFFITGDANVIFNATQFNATGISANLQVQSFSSFTSSVTINNVSGSFSAAGFGLSVGASYRTVINGGALADSITGSSRNDSITGEGGSDTLLGGTGDDTLDGGEGDDVLLGDADVDRLIGGAGNDLFTYTSASQLNGDTIDGGADGGGFGDRLEIGFSGFANLDQITFTSTGTTSIEWLSFTGGGGHSARFFGSQFGPNGVSTNLRIQAEANSTDIIAIENISGVFSAAGFIFDTWDATIDRVDFRGEATADFITGSSQADFILGFDGNNTLVGGGGHDALNGGANDDSLDGGTGDDLLTGQAGNDTLVGGIGADTLNGGNGNDVFAYGAASEITGDTINGGADAGGVGDQIRIGFSGDVDFTGSTASSIEGFSFTGGGAHNAIFNASQFGGRFSFNSSFQGDAAGADTVTINGVSGQFSVAGFSFTTWSASADRIVINGGSTADSITGSSQADSITGGIGDDTIEGGAGNDTADGGTGAGDTLSFASFAPGSGAGGVNFSLALQGLAQNTNAGTDIFSNFERMIGSAFNDSLTGSDGGDTIEGGAGNDTIEGGLGDDTMNGGTGTGDILSFASYVPGSGTVGIVVDLFGQGVAQNTNAGTDTFTGFEGVIGSAFDDTISAGQLSSTIDSGEGNDSLTGSGFNDTLLGGGGNDTLNGSDGDDSLDGGAGNDIYVVGSLADIVSETGADAADEVRTSLNVFSLGTTAFLLNVENLRFTGTGGFTGVGNAGANSIVGGFGVDSLDGGAGADTLVGGLGNDIYVVDSTGDVIIDVVNVNLDPTDEVRTTLNSFTLGVTAGSINIENLTFNGSGSFAGTGTFEANVITGGAGNDTLNGGFGIDTLVGGGGNDVYIVDSILDVISEGVGDAADAVHTALASFTLGAMANSANIENLIFIGGGPFAGTGTAGANFISSTGGEDTLDGLGGADTLAGASENDVYIIDSVLDVILENAGDAGDEVRTTLDGFTLGVTANSANIEKLTFTGSGSFAGTGDSAANVITGGAGNDTLSGGLGADSLVGGTGFDTASYANATTSVQVVMYNTTYNTGEAAGDTFTAIEGLIGSAQGDVLVGDFAQNIIFGGAGDDWIDGTFAGDALYGEGGNDNLASRQQADILDGGADFDFARYDFGDAGLRAYLYDTTQNSGFAAGDVLTSIEGFSGTYFADDLRGDNNQNIIYGLGGADYVIGLGGSDLLIGGDGQDLFHFVGIGDGGPGGDVIQDFVSGNDRISVTGAFFGLGSPGGVAIDSFRFVAGAAANLATSQFIYNGATQQLFYDIDGTGAGVQALLATLQAGATMAAGDIIVI